MDIKSLIRQKLNESTVSQVAKTHGMTHLGFNHWKDRNGLVWNWDKDKKKFERNFDKENEVNHETYNKQPHRALKRKLIGVLDKHLDSNVSFKNLESKINQLIDKYNGEANITNGAKELKQFCSKFYQGKTDFEDFWNKHIVPVLRDIRDDILKDLKKLKEDKKKKFTNSKGN